MDARDPHDRQDRRSSHDARAGATPSRGSRPSRSASWRLGAAIAVVAVLGVIGFVGGSFVLRSKAHRAATAATLAATNAVQGGATSTGVTGTPTRAAKSSAAGDASPSPTGTSSAATAWRDADPSWMDKYRGKLVDGFKTEPGYKAVALTFDDGPNGETKFVIDTLARYGGHATFFDTGRKLAMSWAKTQPAIIWKGDAELGNHTQHHTLPDGISSMWHRSYATDLAEINGPDAFAKFGTGRNTVWLRPMGGMIDATGVKAAVDTNHLVINWTIDSNDSHGGPRTADYIYQQVTTGIKSGDVVLLHVTHPESMAALPRICATLSERGLKMVTLSELAQHSTAAITQHIPK